MNKFFHLEKIFCNKALLVFVAVFLLAFFVLPAGKIFASVSVTGTSADGQYFKCNRTACFSVSIRKNTTPFDPANYYVTVKAKDVPFVGQDTSVDSPLATDASPNQTATVCFTVPENETGTRKDISYVVTSTSTGTVFTNISNYYYVNCNYTDAICGSATTATYDYNGSTTVISAGLCSSGILPQSSPILPAAQGSFITWTCYGVNDGDNATCTARRAIDGVCGTAAKSYSPTETWPTSGYCSVGSASPTNPSNPSQGSSTSWSCSGSYGGLNANCTATRRAPINGTCGSAATTYSDTGSSTTISTNLCSAGNPSATYVILPAAGGSTATWTCAGIDGGVSSSTCTATRLANGICGSAARSYGPAETWPGAYAYCSVGSQSPTNPLSPPINGSTSWTCTSTGNSSNCTATRRALINGTCGSAATPATFYLFNNNSTTIYSNLCSTGAPPLSVILPADQGSTVSWTCSGIDGGTSSNCTATRATNAICGSTARSFSPTETWPGNNYCSIGTANPSTVNNPGIGSSVSWSCVGLNGGNNTDCTAIRRGPINGACGLATTPPTVYQYNGSSNTISTNLCSAGTPPVSVTLPAAQGSTISWTCAGIDGGTGISCQAKRVVNGTCGTANKIYPLGSTSFGSDTICLSGASNPVSPVFPTNTNPSTSWTCTSPDSGATASCTASLVTNGVCGTANKTYPVGSTGFGLDTKCSSGILIPASPLFPTDSAPQTAWTCMGTNGGASINCIANLIVNGTCGYATTPPSTYLYNGTNDGSTFYGGYDTSISYGLCSKGIPTSSSVTLPAAPGSTVSWVCNGINGGSNSASCIAKRVINGTCGTATRDYLQGETFPGTSTYCVSSISPSPASSSLGSAGGSTVTWTCPGAYGGNSSTCTATRATNGACGTANKTYSLSSTSFGSDTFCAFGGLNHLPEFPRNSYEPVAIPPYFMGPVFGKEVWGCYGFNGGTNVSCTAKRVINGTCGTANKTYPAGTGSFGTDSLCATGNVLKDGVIIAPLGFESFPFWPAMASNGIGTWTCQGLNGGTSANCSATLIINAGCGSAVSTPTPYITPDFESLNPCSGEHPSYSCTNYPYTGLSTTISANLCSAGTKPVSNPVLGATQGTSVSWTCSGRNGGLAATCTARRAVNGACGTANKTYPVGSTSYGTDTFCARGVLSATPAFPTLLDQEAGWTCQGLDAGTPISCQAKLRTNGTCGPGANPNTWYVAEHRSCTRPWPSCFPTIITPESICDYDFLDVSGGHNLCSAGHPADPDLSVSSDPVTGGTSTCMSLPGEAMSSIDWTCAGTYGGTNTTCYARRAINGRCGFIGDGLWCPGGACYELIFGPTTPWPTSGFCGSGTSSVANPANPLVGGSTTWTCQGAHGGWSDTCTARRIANPCGTVTTPPTAYYPYTGAVTRLDPACYAGEGLRYPSYVDLPADPGSVATWTCAGVSCSAYRQLIGTCGTAARSYSPTEIFPGAGNTYCLYNGLSSPVAPTAPAVGGSTTWTCLGAYGGTDTSCTATRRAPVNGACGTARTPSTTYLYTGNTTTISANLCSAGGNPAVNPVLPAEQGLTVSWTCAGVEGGTPATCTATRGTKGVCGAATKIYSPTETWPAGSYCSAGNSDPVIPFAPGAEAQSLYYSGTKLKSSIISGAGVTVNPGEQIYTILVKFYTGDGGSYVVNCPPGTSYRVCVESKNDGAYEYVLLGVGKITSWTCRGILGGGDEVCKATRLAPVNGTCGSATTPPSVYIYTGNTTTISANLCSAGTNPATNPILPAAGGSTVTWTCQGFNEGTNTECTAVRSSPFNGTCGTASKTYPAGSTSFGADLPCGVGTASPASPTFPTIASPSTTWYCLGINGGANSPQCAALLTVNGNCGTANKTYPVGSTSFGADLPCGVGTASPASPIFPTVANPSTTWTCVGISGGTTATCTALLTVNGDCGAANKTYPAGSTSFGSDKICNGGTPSPTPTFPTTTNPATAWVCQGVNGGSPSVSCNAKLIVNGACGTAVTPTTVYKYTGNTTTISSNTCSGGGTSDILPATQYIFRVSAINAVDASDPSSSANVTTPP